MDTIVIPQHVVEAAAKAVWEEISARTHKKTWDEIGHTLFFKQTAESDRRVALAAALEAWPVATEDKDGKVSVEGQVHYPARLHRYITPWEGTYMPYVKPNHRHASSVGSAAAASNPGDLTYQMQQLLKKYLERHGLRYQQIAECLGALEGAKLDFIERVVKSYEDKKREENGDVWPSFMTYTEDEEQ
jgi:hypothetical protein